MKIKSFKDFKGKLISFIINDGPVYSKDKMALITSLLVNCYEWSFGQQVDLNIAGLGIVKASNIIAAFDNIEEALAYYEYLIGE